MASSPRPEPASRTLSALRPWMGLAGVVAAVVIFAMGWQALRGEAVPDDVAPLTDYAEYADSRQLQSDIGHLSAEDDWRELADLPEAVERNTNPLAWLTVARVVFWLFVAIAVAIVVFLIYLAVRHGAGLRVDTRKAADAGAYKTAGKGGAAPAAMDLPELSLDEIARLGDVAKALGALQRLVLMAAVEATGSVLRRSDTAREALRRLPRDWAHYDRVAHLVQMAERVRYAGLSLEADGLAGLIEEARPVLAARRAAS